MRWSNAGTSRNVALRTTWRSISASTSTGAIELDMQRSSLVRYQPRPDELACQQFGHNTGPGAGCDHHLGNACFQGFGRGFQLGSHTAGSNAIFNKIPALIQTHGRTDLIVLIAHAIDIGQEQELVHWKGGCHR